MRREIEIRIFFFSIIYLQHMPMYLTFVIWFDERGVFSMIEKHVWVYLQWKVVNRKLPDRIDPRSARSIRIRLYYVKYLYVWWKFGTVITWEIIVMVRETSWNFISWSTNWCVNQVEINIIELKIKCILELNDKMSK